MKLFNEEEFDLKQGGRGYYYSSSQTFEGEYFRVSTGRVRSHIQLKDSFGDEAAVHIEGEFKASSDEECWAAILELKQMPKIIKALVDISRKNGRNEMRKELKDLLTNEF